MVFISENPIDNIIIGVIAIAFLVFVADKVIEKSIKISKRLGISQIFIGLTIISIGTSLPEITTHVGLVYEAEGALPEEKSGADRTVRADAVTLCLDGPIFLHGFRV